MLELNTNTKSDVLLVELDGALDSQTSSDFKAWIEEKIIEGYLAFGLDFHKLKYLSSRGIGVLVELNRLLNLKEGKIVLYHVRSEVQKLLDFLKISDDIIIEIDSEEAIVELQKLNPAEKISESTVRKEEIHLLREDDLAENVDNIASNEESKPEETATPASAPLPMFSETNVQVEDDLHEDHNSYLKYDNEKELSSTVSQEPLAANELLSEDDEFDLTEPERIKDDENDFFDFDESDASQVEEKPLPFSQESELDFIDERFETDNRFLKYGGVSDMVSLEESDYSKESSSVIVSKQEPPQNSSKLNVVEVVYCPNCGHKLRVSKPGKYLCPECRTRFQYPFVT